MIGEQTDLQRRMLASSKVRDQRHAKCARRIVLSNILTLHSSQELDSLLGYRSARVSCASVLTRSRASLNSALALVALHLVSFSQMSTPWERR